MTRGLMKSTSCFAIAAAAGLFATSAMAADLGGNCCADLEERVAELEATAARKGNRKVSLTVYGQVNQAIIWHDDEYGYREGKLTVRDNSAGTSRFGFRGEAQIRPDLTAGYVIEIGLDDMDFSIYGDKAFMVRHNYAYLSSSTFGRLAVGQTSQATDGLYEINLANTVTTPGGMDEHAFVLNPFLSSFFSPGFDGSRRQGIYYSTPTLAGFILSAGYAHNTQSGQAGYVAEDSDTYYDIALRYAGEFNGVRVAFGVGYRKTDDDGGNDVDTYIASGSVMHTPTGLFVSAGYAKSEYDVNDFDFVIKSDKTISITNTLDRRGFWVTAGIEKNWFGVGATTLYGEYNWVEYDALQLGDVDGSYWGLGAVQKIDAAATDLYLQFRKYEMDLPFNVPFDEAKVVTGGMRIQF